MCGDTPLDETSPWIVEFITNVMTYKLNINFEVHRCCNELYFMSACHC